MKSDVNLINHTNVMTFMYTRVDREDHNKMECYLKSLLVCCITVHATWLWATGPTWYFMSVTMEMSLEGQLYACHLIT